MTTRMAASRMMMKRTIALPRRFDAWLPRPHRRLAPTHLSPPPWRIFAHTTATATCRRSTPAATTC
eukprot:52312-Eustigmatos_ZCMA.PRE.1